MKTLSILKDYTQALVKISNLYKYSGIKRVGSERIVM